MTRFLFVFAFCILKKIIKLLISFSLIYGTRFAVYINYFIFIQHFNFWRQQIFGLATLSKQFSSNTLHIKRRQCVWTLFTSLHSTLLFTPLPSLPAHSQLSNIKLQRASFFRRVFVWLSSKKQGWLSSIGEDVIFNFRELGLVGEDGDERISWHILLRNEERSGDKRY